MRVNFEVEFLPDAVEFLEALDEKTREKIYFNIRKSQLVVDVELFKKLNNVIWEFRTSYNGNAYRLYAFWDISASGPKRIVVATHGIQKNKQKTPVNEIRRAEGIRKRYLDIN